METDYCDVVSTNRSQQSGGGSSSASTGTKATAPSPPRSNHSTRGSDNDHEDIFDDRAMSKHSSTTRPVGVGIGNNRGLSVVVDSRSPPTCSVCGGDVGDYLSQSQQSNGGIGTTPGEKNKDHHWDHNRDHNHNHSHHNNNSSNGSIDRRTNHHPETMMCLDCRARSRREKKLLNRLPKQSIGTTIVSNSQESKADHSYSSSLLSHSFNDNDNINDTDGYLHNNYRNNNNSQKESNPNSQSQQQQQSNNSNKSTFRNRLQAARDEHHFIEDDYLP